VVGECFRGWPGLVALPGPGLRLRPCQALPAAGSVKAGSQGAAPPGRAKRVLGSPVGLDPAGANLKLATELAGSPRPYLARRRLRYSTMRAPGDLPADRSIRSSSGSQSTRVRARNSQAIAPWCRPGGCSCAPAAGAPIGAGAHGRSGIRRGAKSRIQPAVVEERQPGICPRAQPEAIHVAQSCRRGSPSAYSRLYWDSPTTSTRRDSAQLSAIPLYSPELSALGCFPWEEEPTPTAAPDLRPLPDWKSECPQRR